MGIGDEIKGKAKEMAGKVTDDENQELEGKKLQEASDDDAAAERSGTGTETVAGADTRAGTDTGAGTDTRVQEDAATTTERKTVD